MTDLRKLSLVLVVALASLVVLVWLLGARLPLSSAWVRGIDVSHHQGEIDWEVVAGDDVHFVWMKATEGGDWTDPRFEENWKGAGEVGIDRGAYHFFTFCRPASEQAAHFLAVVPHAEADLAPVVDVEYGGNCSKRPSTSELGAELAVFMDAVQVATGKRPLVYVTGGLYRDHPALFQAEDLWVRAIYHEPSREVPLPATVWQYSNVGRVDGIEGRVDLNVKRRRGLEGS